MVQLATTPPTVSDDGDESDEIESTPLLSLRELRRVVAATAGTGKTPAAFLRDAVIAAVDGALADDVRLDALNGDRVAAMRALTEAIRAMIEPVDEVLAVLATTPERIELNDEERRRFTEALLDPPEPNEALKAAIADYRVTLATIERLRSPR